MSIRNGLTTRQKRANLEFEILVYNAAKDGKLYRLKVFLGQNSKKEIAQLVSARTNGATPLIIACRNGHYDIVTYLVEECNADIEETGTVAIDGDAAEGATPLWVAARAGHLNIVIYLVKRKASINYATKSNSTPLRAACGGNHFEVARYLWRKGADMEIANQHGHTCLMIACRKGSREIVEFLVKAGADVNRKSSNGSTALHECAQDCHFLAFKLLLENGAAVVPDSSGKTPLLSAALSGQREIVEYFVENYPCTKPEKINALELLGTYFVDVEQSLLYAVGLWKRAMKLRYEDKDFPLVKPETPTPLGCHLEMTEIQTLSQLEVIDLNPDALRTQSLLIRERILGFQHPDSLHLIRKRGEAYKKSLDFQRCIKLWMYALDVQPKGEEPLSQETYTSFLHFTELFYIMFRATQHVQDEQPFVSFHDIFHVFNKAVREIETDIELSQKQNQNLNDLRLSKFLFIVLHLVRLICILQPHLSESQVSDFKEVLYRLVLLNPKGMKNWTLLHIACYRDTVSGLSRRYTFEFPSAKIVDLLLELGASPHALDLNLNTPLHFASTNQPFVREIFDSLLNHGAHLDQCNSDRQTPHEMVQRLVPSFYIHPLQYVNLQCLSARVVKVHQIPYKGLVHKKLEVFLDGH